MAESYGGYMFNFLSCQIIFLKQLYILHSPPALYESSILPYPYQYLVWSDCLILAILYKQVT